MTQLGLRARTIRAARGESQEAVARRADISVATYGRIENGHNAPSLETLVRIAAALEVTVDELVAPMSPDKAGVMTKASADGTQATLDGLDPQSVKVSFVGAQLELGPDTEPYGLGESVEFTVKGHVILIGSEALESEGVRRVVKIRCDTIFAT